MRLRNEIRANQFLNVFGVGAMMDVDQQSIMVCSPDAWKTAGGKYPLGNKYQNLPVIKEDALLARIRSLGDYTAVESLRKLPEVKGKKEEEHNRDEVAQIAAIRFPEWLYCPRCHKFNPIRKWSAEWIKDLNKDDQLRTETRNQLIERFERTPFCNHCRPKGKSRGMPKLIPISIVEACPHGHISDFPWREWCGCKSKDHELEFQSKGSDLGRQYVICEECNCRRSLAGIFEQDALKNLNIACGGLKPWVGKTADGCFCHDTCHAIPRGIQRNSTNVYFAHGISGLTLPMQDEIDCGIVAKEKRFSAIKEDYDTTHQIDENDFNKLVKSTAEKGLSEKRTRAALERLLLIDINPADDEMRQIRNEFLALRDGMSVADIYFEVHKHKVNGGWFECVNKVDRVREVSVPTHFTRLYASAADASNKTDKEGSPITVRKQLIAAKDATWLPACESFGEGVFVSVSAEHLNGWYENNQKAFSGEYSSLVQSVHDDADGPHQPQERVLFTVLHTLCHCLMTRMAISSGYSLTALKEKIYCSTGDDKNAPFYGFLIYTVSADKCGTLGGLARFGEVNEFKSVLVQALTYAEHCSADPLCAEHPSGIASRASCFACTFLPETSCSHFNRWLDRLFVRNRPSEKRGWEGVFNGEVDDHIVELTNNDLDETQETASLELTDLDRLCHDDWLFQINDDHSGVGFVEELNQNLQIFENKEKPYGLVEVTFSDGSKGICDYVWDDSKVAIFSDDNINCYNKLSKCVGWKCVLLSAPNISVTDFVAMILGGK